MLWPSLAIVMVLLLQSCTNHHSAPVRDLSPVSKSQENYRVKKGDTLFGIAFRSGVDVQDLARWNDLSAPYTIYVGSTLSLRTKPIIAGGKQLKNPPSNATKPAPPVNRKIASKPLPKIDLPRKVDKWVWPVKGKLIATFSVRKGRNGIQIAAPSATPVAAAAGGQVVYAGSGIRGYGRLIIIQHSEDFLSAYAHNESMFVAEGQRIKQGQKIAEVGRSGTNTTKLHFEIRKDGKPVNPLKYLPLKSA